MRTFEQEEKSVEGVEVPENVDGKQRTWPLESGHVTPKSLRSQVRSNKRGSKTPF